MGFHLTKTLPAVLPAQGLVHASSVSPLPNRKGRYHASWSIKEIPGLEICGYSSPKTSGERHDHWLVGKSMAVGLFLNRAQWSSSTEDDGRYDLALQIIDKLQDQQFATRREALQAVEMALLQIAAEEEEGATER